MDQFAGSCNGCGASGSPLMKFSLGKDFFGRIYDRLSPSADQSPKWYCDTCSMQKNWQRDFRDIRIEYDKLTAGLESELAKGEEFRRASLRLREIMTLLETVQPHASLLAGNDVKLLLERLNTATMPV